MDKNKIDNNFGYPMNLRAYATRGIIWGQRLVFAKWFKDISDHRPMPFAYEQQKANDALKDLLGRRSPCFIGRFGCVELEATLRGWDIAKPMPKLLKFARIFTGNFGPFWWDNSIKLGLLRGAGVFPVDEKTLMRFSARMLEDSKQLDMLASWNSRERQLSKIYFPNALSVPLSTLEPFRYNNPWSMVLKGHKVLVIHPFEETIRTQYARRRDLFADENVMPDFDLITYRPVLSFLGLKTPYKDWFEALNKMCEDISKIDFDIALIGCGAYGFPLGAFVKRDLARKAIHIGGATQLLFGIRGGRWDNHTIVKDFYNDYWVRPTAAERPSNAEAVENACYW